MLIRHLPPESATHAAYAGVDQRWSITDHLLASAVDVLMAGNWQRAGNRRAPKPKPLQRPSSARTRRRSNLTPQQMHHRLMEQRRRREARGS